MEAVLCKCFLFPFLTHRYGNSDSEVTKICFCGGKKAPAFQALLRFAAQSTFKNPWWHVMLWCWPYFQPRWKDGTLGHRWHQTSHKLETLEYFSNTRLKRQSVLSPQFKYASCRVSEKALNRPKQAYRWCCFDAPCRENICPETETTHVTRVNGSNFCNSFGWKLDFVFFALSAFGHEKMRGSRISSKKPTISGFRYKPFGWQVEKHFLFVQYVTRPQQMCILFDALWALIRVTI